MIATVLGNALEWFDFSSYAFLASIIAANFFPSSSPLISLLGGFAVFGVGFIARPIGAIFFGRLGDDRGRKLALLISMPMMGIGTLLVGCTPTFATIGILAPALLVVGRLMQGFAAGGEVGNAMAFLAEWAPSHRRALYSSLQQWSAGLGSLSGSILAAALSSLLPAEELHHWGWRIPFLLGGLIITPIAMFLRRHVDETPIFKEDVAADHNATPPAFPWRNCLRAGAITATWVTTYYVYLAYLASFLQAYSKISAASALWANTAGILTNILVIPLAAMLSDRIGRRPPLIVASIIAAAVAYPSFAMLQSSPSIGEVYGVTILAGALSGTFAGVIPATLTEMFPTAQRTTGVSIGFGLATAVLGGFAPFIATGLIGVTGHLASPSAYLIVAALGTAIVAFRHKETAFDDLRH